MQEGRRKDFLEQLNLPSNTRFAKFYLRECILYYINRTVTFSGFTIALEQFDLRRRDWYTAMFCVVDRWGFLVSGRITIERDGPHERIMTPRDLKQLYETFSKNSQKFVRIERLR